MKPIRLCILARAAAPDAANAEGAPPLHKGPWPICNGLNYQPTERELRALHEEDVTPDQAREIDRLYDQLLASTIIEFGFSIKSARTCRMAQ